MKDVVFRGLVIRASYLHIERHLLNGQLLTIWKMSHSYESAIFNKQNTGVIRYLSSTFKIENALTQLLDWRVSKVPP